MTGAVQEYPKALYRNGEYKAVADGPEEHAARIDGFMDWADDHAAMNAPKAEAAPVASPVSAAAAEPVQPASKRNTLKIAS